MANKGNSNLELALRIRADLDQAVSALREVESGLDKVGASAGKSSDALGKVDGGDAIAKVGQAANEAAAGLQREAETAEQAEQRIRAMVQASLEYQRALNEQLVASQAAGNATASGTAATEAQVAAVRQATEAAFASQAATTAQIQSIGELHGRIERGARSNEDLAETEQLLDRAVRAGLVSSEEQAAMFVQLDKQEKQLIATRQKEEQQVQALLRAYDPASAALAKLERDEENLTKAVNDGTLSREKYNRAMVGITTQRAQWQQYSDGVEETSKKLGNLSLTAREVRTSLAGVASNLAQGNIDAAGSSLLNLGTRGAASLGLLGFAVGGVVAGLGLLAAASYQSYVENRQLELSLISSGNAAGTYAGHLAEVRNSTASATGEYAKAQTAVVLLANSGQVAADMLETAAGAAMNLSELTGASIEQTTAKIISLAKAPSATLEQLNQDYHFLTLEVYEHVRSLEEQGNQTEATRVALEAFAGVHEQRVTEARARAGDLERAWNAVRGAVMRAWQSIKDAGRADVDYQLQIQRGVLRQQQLYADHVKNGGFIGLRNRDTTIANADAEVAAVQKRIDALEAEKKGIEERTAAEAKSQGVQDAGVTAAKAIQQQLDSGAPKAEKLAAAVAKVKQQFVDLRAAVAAGNADSALLTDVVFGADGSISGGAYDKALKGLQEQFKERSRKGAAPKKTDGQKADDAARRELDNLAKQVSLLGELEDGEKKASQAARIRYEIEEGAYQNASPALQQQLVDQAQLLDGENARIEAAKKLVEVHLEIARLQGRGSEAALAKTNGELQKLHQQLDNIGKTADAADVAKLMNLNQAAHDRKGMQETYNQAMGQIALEQQRIQVELQAGLISEADAQQRIVDLYKTKLGTLHELVPQMRAAAIALGDPAALANVEQIALKLQEMSATTNLLQQHISTTFQESFKSGVMSLVDGTATLSEAVATFFTNMALGMAEFIAQDWSQKAAGWLTTKTADWLGGAAESASETAGAVATQTAAVALTTAGTTVAAGATAVGASAATLAGSGGALIGGAAAISAAAIQLQAAATTMMVANSMSSASGFANGGFTGWGGKYVPAGVVHKGEGVARQEVMRQPGALPFFLDFNRRGMAAVDAWANGYADGGYVGPAQASIAAMPQARPADMSQILASPAVINRIKMMSFFDVDLLAQEIAKTPHFEKAVVHTAGSNGKSIRGEWEG